MPHFPARLKALAGLLALQPHSPEGSSMCARTAGKDFERCLALSNGEPSCTANLAFLYNRTGRPKLAAPLEDRLAGLSGNSRHGPLAVAGMGRQDHAAALKHLSLAA